MTVNVLSPRCPECGALITRVVATKRDLNREQLVRRRHCEFCDHRFYTAQPVERVAEVKWTGGGTGSLPMVMA